MNKKTNTNINFGFNEKHDCKSCETKCKCTNTNFGFLGLLQILFIGLKLTGYLTWSWFWVLFPAIIVFLFVGSILIIGILCWIILKIWGD